MTKLCFDFDFIIFDAVCIAEERFIIAKHLPSGREIELPNKTALWGHHAKKAGGWISEQNKEAGNDYWKPEDFEVIEGQRPKPFKVKGKIDEWGVQHEDYFKSPWEGAKDVLDSKIFDICAKLGTTDYYGYTGSGETFRESLGRIQHYKGNRNENLRPLLLDRMKKYVCDRHNATMVKWLESDDRCNIDTNNAYNAWRHSKLDKDKVIQVAEDKDAKQCSGWHYNPNKDSTPRLIEGFGKLWLDSKGDVDGAGRIFLYYQIASSDSSDNYSANCVSELKWGSKSAYKELVDCTDDKEAFEALVRIYKHLYPEPKIVTGWKGDTFEITWLDVLTENFNFAKMLRSVDEQPTDVKAVLDKLGITY